jgi:hypothetical protein
LIYRTLNLCQDSNRHAANQFFELNGDRLEPAEHDLDLVLWSSQVSPHTVAAIPGKFKLCVDICHASENKIQGWSNVDWLNWLDSYVLVECESDQPHPKIISSNWMFNRTKAFYQHHEFVSQPVWYWTDAQDYQLCGIDKTPTKIFVMPCKRYSNRPARAAIIDHINTRWSLQGHMGHWPNRMLISNRYGPDLDLDSVLRLDPAACPVNGYSPVHNRYYQDSYISIYCETLEHGSTHLVTEKTLDPLIKGHFVLPYGYRGLIQSIQSMGFQLPDFVDYSYDSADDDSRLALYLKEVDRLMSISLGCWHQYWLDNLDIIQHNRSVFEHTEYYHIDFESLINGEKYERTLG